jgi:hypothetical protein
MQIDYDGINDWFYEQTAKADQRLLDDLAEEFPGYQPRLSWEICDMCHGDGSHSRNLGVIDRDEWDPDDFDDYMSGRYDSPCVPCNGSGKVRRFDIDSAPTEIRDWFVKASEAIHDSYATQRQEMMYGA